MATAERRARPSLDLNLLHRIVVEAAAAHTFEAQIRHLVVNVREALGVDVCSLYQRGTDDVLYMLANTGFAVEAVSEVALPWGQGLVGHIAQHKLPLNLRVASDHAAYRYFPHLGEENFQAFLGVPIVQLGEVIGVLVVQDRDQRGFTADEEAFLVTMAAQLAGLLLRMPTVTRQNATGERTLKGMGAAPGKAIGHLHLLVGEQTLGLVEDPPAASVEEELQRLANASTRTAAEVDRAKQRFAQVLSHEVLAVFDLYRQMLSGDQLIASARAKIRDGCSAFAAVRAAMDEIVVAFEAVEDDYIRSRSEDVRHVGSKLLTALLGENTPVQPALPNVVLLGGDISVTDLAGFAPGQIAGIVCLRGSTQSHSVMLARALGIPAVTAIGPVDHIRQGGSIVVDGDQGLLILEPTADTLRIHDEQIAARKAADARLLLNKDAPAVSTDGVRVELFVNTGLLSDITPGIERGAEGIGLYRSELPFLQHQTFPTEDEQYRVYRETLAAYAPKPVTMRTLDVGADKQLPYLTFSEQNPALGWRGIRFSLDNPATLVTQLRAMLRADMAFGNLRVLLPMVSTVADTRAAVALVDEVVAALRQQGQRVRRPLLGIMVEVPSVISQLASHAALVDFVSIGTNDLTQYLLAVDRTNTQVAIRFDHLHPSVLRAVADVIGIARSLDLPLCVCGEMAADPAGAFLLLGMGCTALSMNAYSLPQIKTLLLASSAAEARQLARQALAMEESAEVRRAVAPWLKEPAQALC